MKIRPATETDRLPLFKLCAAMHAESDLAPVPFNPQRALDNLGRWLSGTGGWMLVADDNGEMIGFLAATQSRPWFSDAETLGEDLLYVRPDRRHGRAAWKLVEAFVGLAQTLGVAYARASVATGEHGAAAERLYQRHGMHRVGGAYAIHF